MMKKRQPCGPRQRAAKTAGVNWWVIAGAIAVLAVIVFLSINRSSVAEPADESASGASSRTLSWSEPPAMTIDTSKTYSATFKTEHGDIVVELYADLAPITVNNFVFLARQGFYDNTTFHRVIPGFMAQGGDPTGTGAGGPGYKFEDEVDTGLSFARAGLLAMANSGPATNGSQFFITYGPATHLDGKHTIFGEVVEGMDVALALRERDPQTDTQPGSLLYTVEIEEH